MQRHRHHHYHHCHQCHIITALIAIIIPIIINLLAIGISLFIVTTVVIFILRIIVKQQFRGFYQLKVVSPYEAVTQLLNNIITGLVSQLQNYHHDLSVGVLQGGRPVFADGYRGKSPGQHS